VETPDRPDGARRGNAEFYRLLHAGHRSVVADPADPDGRRLLHALVDAADIVIEASRPRALAGWGLAPSATNATWVSITAAGRRSHRIGFGDDVAAGAGLVARDATGPVFVGDAIADPLAGLTAAARAIGATPGSLVEVSMHDGVAATLDSSPTEPAGEVAAPRARTPRGEAPSSGADTEAVRRELRC
jgi:crotonobetainyl-CoA:carnitine CoA-transferase CaiB-like acyl-CoA transferase